MMREICVEKLLFQIIGLYMRARFRYHNSTETDFCVVSAEKSLYLADTELNFHLLSVKFDTVNFGFLYLKQKRGTRHMVKVLLLSHGTLCAEMLKTMKLIVGDVTGFEAVVQPEDGNMTLYESSIAQQLMDGEDTLVITDLLGGSPLITVAKVYGEHQQQLQGKVKIITGMNLGMLLEVHGSLATSSLDELADTAVKAGQTSVTDFLENMRRNQA